MNARRSPLPESSSNLIAHLRTLAHVRPNDIALVVAGADSEISLDYAELDLRVRALAAELQAKFRPGDRALLLLDSDEYYVIGFLACLYAGLVAVPAFPPESARPQHMARLGAIARDAQSRCALVNSSLMALLAGADTLLEGIEVVAVDAVSHSGADGWEPRHPTESDIAFLQYTSGSTAAPKGVIVDHGNLMANERAIQAALQTSASDVFVSWLPLFHDMGLVGGLFHPIYCGIPLVLMSPSAFLERPVRWLHMLSQHRGTISGGPDFAYRLCLERITDAQLKTLDLSSWRLAFSGAEPVRHDTLHAFADRFAAAGFDRSAVFPCYGLAEATLFVTGVRAGGGMTAKTYSSERLAQGVAEASVLGTTLVACGSTQAEHHIRIVDPQGRIDTADGHIGEIWVGGPSVSRGYWQRSEETEQIFVEREGLRWLRTGDLGFVQQGQLCITGRLKDLIILRGHNVYPQDIERAVEEEIEAVRKGRVAAFAVPTATGEGVGIAVEVSRGLQKLVPADRLFSELNTVVSTLCREPLAVALLLNPGALPKTSSGKLQRSACRQGWQQRSLDAYAVYENGQSIGARAGDTSDVLTQTECEISAIWGAVLQVKPPLAAGDNFFALGGSSVTAAQMIARVERQFGIRMALRSIFAAPSIREFAAEIERTRSATASSDVPAMARVPRHGRMPLSPAQNRMWFLWQLDPQSAAYNVGGGLRLRGRIDSTAIQRALHELSERHEVLRTLFPVRDAVAVQEVQAAAQLSMDLIDLRQWPVAEREERAQTLAAAELQRPFDLQSGPLLRATLLRFGDDDHLLLITTHHIVADGVSMALLVEDFIRLYASRGTLPPPALQYVDYAAWQQEWLGSGERERQLEYWANQLGRDYPDVRPRPDRPVRRASDDRGRRLEIPVDAVISRRVHEFARQQGVTPFMVLLAAWKVVLARHSGHDDVRVGAPVANRRNIESESIVGPFVNTVVLRTSLAGNPTVRELLQRAARTVLEAHAHQDLPFEQLVEALATDRSGHPLFQVMHNHQRRERTSFSEVAPLHIDAFERHGDSARFDLTLNTQEEGDSLSAAITYSTALYDEPTIARVAQHWLNALNGIVAAPESPIEQIAMMGESETTQLLHEFNDTARDFAEVRLLHELIEQQAARTPDAQAVIFESRSCSYRDLNRRANRLAGTLREHGVGPDVLVGICSDRSLELIVGLLAIMKSGGAYVPLDPSYPQARLAFIVEDARPRVLLAERRVLDRLPPAARQAAWLLDDVTRPTADDCPDLPNIARQDNLAYCLYTSGSTGQPKCAGNTHAALLNQLLWRQDVYAMDASHRVLHKTPFGFDVSVWEVFWPLLTGATLIVAPAGAHKDPWRLRQLINEQRVTTLHFVPPMLNAFLEASELQRCESLRHVFVGGQALSTQAQEAFFRQCGARLHHLYGPTEAAIDVTYWECSPTTREAVVPIGRPIANTQLYVLDGELTPVSVGAVGELYIAGVALARGYVNRPGLTAAQFLPNPFTPGARLYRTGDLARYRADGALEYVGRVDHQVKVRGFRIELGEIEARLREYPGVHETVVQIGRDLLGENELIAYVGAHLGEVDDAGLAFQEQLRRHLAARLPDYMLPMRYVVLDSLPLLANGKIDRVALTAYRPLQARQQHVAPRNELEQRLADIWSEVLHVPALGIHNSFFELGGHSLLATKAVARIRQAFDIDLPLRALFESTNLEDFAEQVRHCIAEGRKNAHGPIAIVDRSRPLPLSYSQQRMWTLWLLEPLSPAYNLSGAVRLTGPFDATLLESTLAILLQRHETLRTTFCIVDGHPAQCIAERIDVPLARIDLSGLSSEDQQSAVIRQADEEGHRPFDLRTGPLLRVLLLKLSAVEHVMIITTHHVVAEGWAVEIFAREITAVYQCLLEGRPVDLAPLPVQYVDYVQWQQQWLAGGELDRQLAYWRQQLTGEHEVLALPTDRSRPKVLSAAGDLHRFRIEPALAQRLRAFGAERGATLFMTLVTGFFALLHRYTAQADLRVGVPVANRVRPEAEGLIGAFLNTQVLRCRVAEATSFAELLRQVQQSVVAAQSHQDLPFDRLVEAIKPPRSLSFHPLFQAMFNLHRWDFQRRSRMGEAVVEFLPNDVRAAKLDLMLDVGDLSDALDCCLTYSTDLFERATVERLAEHWVQMLTQMTEQPQARIASAQLLTEAERLCLREWGTNQRTHAGTPAVQRLFEIQAQRQPQATALVFKGDIVSYHELNVASNRLAHRLIALGVGPEVRVAISAERSIELVIAVLAVLKAGGSYVPLDPAYPQVRLDFMMQDSGVQLLLTQRSVADRFAAAAIAMLLLDDGDWQEEPTDNPRPALHDDHPAYTIYTSGSTGRPKGVVVRHGALSNFLASMRDAPGLAADDVLVAATSLSFDIAALEIYLPLIVGAQLVLASATQVRDGVALAKLLEQHRATVFQATPSGWRLLLASGWNGSRSGILRGLCGGEALPPDLAQQLHDCSVELWNMYGPTETTIWSSTGRVNLARPSLGRPIAATQLYVLDGELQPAAVGMPGELYIGGAGLARGYLQRAALTSERFIADPFGEAGGRLYRTGDCVRWTGDQLQFLNRSDHQVKIRGFRIELGEIEAQLLAQPEVREAVVLAADGPNGARLVAYVVCAEAIEPTQIREQLSGSLPDHMVPATVTVLERMPLTDNGKLDRKALPAPAMTEPDRYEEPRGLAETALAAIWSQLLRVERVGRHDNFFELGGDSILTVRIVACSHAAGWKITPRQLFECQTIAQLAAIARPIAATVEPTEVPVVADVDAALRKALPVPGNQVADVYPLTPLQQGLLFHDLRDGADRAYIRQLRIDIDELDVRRFVAAWQAACDRHEILRSGFFADGDVSLQWVARRLELPFAEHDLSQLEEVSIALDSLAATQLATPFDLLHPPLMRLAVARVADHRHHFIWTHHHLLTDGWSAAQLLSEVLRHYDGQLLAPPQGRFRDYVYWVQRQDRQAAQHYWKQRLQSLEAPTLLAGTVAAAELAQKHGYVDHLEAFDAEQTAQLQTSARQERVTLNTLVQAAWALLLSHYTAQRCVSFGVTTAGRPAELPGVQQMVGLFINTYPVIAAVDAEECVGDWLRGLQAQNVASREHEHAPLHEIQRWAGAAGEGLFDTLLAFENYPIDEALRNGVAGSLTFTGARHQEQTHYPLTITAISGDGLSLRFSARRDSFDDRCLVGIATQLRSLLHALAEGIRRSVGELSLLPDAEGRLLDQWGICAADWACDEPVHRLFEKQAALHPDATALTFGATALTYRELNARANRLARRLVSLGVRAEVRVSIAADRSIELVVALLAVLKAGGVYVPLDPKYPQQRLSYMSADSGASLLLTQSKWMDRFASLGGQQLCLDRSDWDGEPAENLPTDLHEEHAAYVIYTSGSTGQPKAVVVRHGALSNFLFSMRAAPGLCADDVLVAVTSLSFDIAALEIYLPLIVGAQLVLASDAEARDGSALAALLDSSAATVMQATPSGWRSLLAAGWTGATTERLRGLCGGEALPSDLATQLHDRNVELWNMYGPTETTIWSSVDKVDPARPSLGTPIAATQLRVLSANLQQVPVGMPGELYIGGTGLARGYLHRSGLTATRFIADPFAPASRLYRTGDLVRWSVGGKLQFLGRIDHQVKIRGHRIELGEIEAQLRLQPDVQEAAVVAKEGPGGLRLVAYVVGRAAILDVADLSRRLASTLPEYMVPGSVVTLASLPMTDNGKLDRKALPAPERSTENRYEAPLGDTETTLSALWGKVLGVERIGRHDSFFELGGDSIVAMRLVSRIQRELHVTLCLPAVFEHRSLARMSAHIETIRSSGVAGEPVLVPIDRAGKLPLSPAQLPLWIAERLDMDAKAGESAYVMSAALELNGELHVAALRAALQTILERHEVLRTCYPEEDGDPYAVILPAATIAMPVDDLSGAAPAEQPAQLKRLWRAQRRGFDLASGPVFRVRLVKFGPTRHVLIIAVHHIAFDGWSQSVFVRELVNGYATLSSGSSLRPAPLPIQYIDYAGWHTRNLSAPAFDAAAQRWKTYLHAAPGLSTIAGDFVRPARRSTVGDTVNAAIDSSVLARLRDIAKEQNTTLFTVLFAAFSRLLHQRTGADDLVIGTDVAGRQRPHLEELLGYFVNVVPLRSRCDAEPINHREWLLRTQASVLSAFEHQDLPFEKLLELSGVPRAGNHNPLVQVLFVLQNLPPSRFDIPGLDVAVLPAPVEHSKFDLAVFVQPDGNVSWVYSSALYRRQSVQQWLDEWLALLQQIAQAPELTREVAAMPVQVRTGSLQDGQQLPLVITANDVTLDGAFWAKQQRSFIETALRRHAAVLFRNFDLPTPSRFEAFASAVEPELFGDYGDLPKQEGGQKTYRSTPYPADKSILFHNESSHLERWPRKQWFFCEQPATVGGATPIVDCRTVLDRLPPLLVDRMQRVGLLYVRTFTKGLDVNWREFFKTDSKEAVNRKLRDAGIDWRWLAGDELQTRTRCPAVIRHPLTGERVFFNQLQLHHPSCLDPELREDLLMVAGPDRLPRNVYYGDGAVIDDADVATICRVYEECAVRFTWQRGDVLMLDNMLAAHGRDPYEGPRKIVVAMGAMFDRSKLGGSTLPMTVGELR